MQQVDFPKYLSAPRLFFIFESDELIVAGSTFLFSLGVIGIIIGINFLVTFLISIGITWFITRNYIKYSKEKSPGYLQHKLYEMGFFKSSKKDEPFVPYGFEDEFKD